MDRSGSGTVNEPDDHLDILGQQPLLKIYTQICSCFSLADPASHPEIVNTLTTGLQRLSASFPWVAGQVVNEGSIPGNTGIFKIKALESIPQLIVKDLRHDLSIPTMAALRRADFPISMLDETIIAPRNTLPGSYGESVSDSEPVFLVQATFITGGLILCLNASHMTMDMTGQGQMIRLLSKACHGEQFTSEELSSGNLARRNLIPLLGDSYKPGAELARQIISPTPSHPVPSDTNEQRPKCTWAYFDFHSTSLSALKSLATKTIPLSCNFVSTDDALSAFIWQSVIRARLPRLNPKVLSTFARAVDVRQYLDIPKTYPGLLQNMTYHAYMAEKLADEPLGGIASQLRSAVDPKTSSLGYRTRCLATLLSRSADKRAISFTATLDPSVDVMFSSWAKIDCYGLDFNLGLGLPEAVRRPRFVPVEGLVYLMPRTPDGDIAAAICLREEDMERLRADEKFALYGRYIG
jgi:hypothetical protein